jgi:hypothetical protein
MAQYYKLNVTLDAEALESGVLSTQRLDVVVPTVGPAGEKGDKGDKGDPGDQGPQGVPGTGLEVLTTQGDILYQGATTGERLPIGAEGEVLKVESGVPAWGEAGEAYDQSLNTEDSVLFQQVAIQGLAGDGDQVLLTDDQGNLFRASESEQAQESARAGLGLGTAATSDAGDFAAAVHGHVAADISDFATTAAAAAPVSSVAGRTGAITLAVADVSGAVADTDARLSDTRDPNAHAASHLPEADDEIFDQSLNTNNNVTFAEVECDFLRGGSVKIFDGGSGFSTEFIPPSLGLSDDREVRFPDASGTLALTDDIPDPSAATPQALGTAAAGTSDDYSRGDHVHAAPALNDLSNVSAATPSDNDVLVFDTATGNWVAEAPAASGIAETLLDAKGDLIVASAADTAARLAVGTNGHVLTADSVETTGVKWAALPAGGSTNLWIPASAWIPRTTTGCGVDSRETSTNNQNFDELLFDAGTDEFAQALVIMPSNYNNSTITARFYWTAASGSGDVIWGLQGRAFANDDALDTAHGTAQTATDTLLAADDMHVSAATSAVTIGGTPAANTPIQFQVYRDADAGGDTLAVDARLLGVEIIFN